MIKELRPIHDEICCDICERTILKGERVETYLAPGGQRVSVCELCEPRAKRASWVREVDASEVPARRSGSDEGRGTLLGRLGFGRRRGKKHADATETVAVPGDWAPQPPAEDAPAESTSAPAEPDVMTPPTNGRAAGGEARHVRAVPTDSQIKISRGLRLFNESEFRHTIAGIGRTLGGPQVSVVESPDTNHEVLLTVAWELSWYQYVVDLAESDDPVRLERKGDEVRELDEAFRQWNASAHTDGLVEMTASPA